MIFSSSEPIPGMPRPSSSEKPNPPLSFSPGFKGVPLGEDQWSIIHSQSSKPVTEGEMIEAGIGIPSTNNPESVHIFPYQEAAYHSWELLWAKNTSQILHNQAQQVTPQEPIKEVPNCFNEVSEAIRKAQEGRQ